MTADDSILERVTNLESMMMHFQRDLDQMSEVIRLQGNDIESLNRRLERMNEKFQPTETDLPDPLDEKPPHY